MRQPKIAILRFLLALSGLLGAASLQARNMPATQCSPSVAASVRTSFGVNLLAPPGDAGAAANSGEIKPAIAATCASWPADRALTVAAFAYDDGTGDYRRFIVTMVDPRRKRPVASYTSAIPEDSATRVRADSIRIDLAPYNVSPTLRAFAIRTSTFVDRCSYEGGRDDDLTLLAIQGSAVRPLLQLTMARWGFERGNRCMEEVPMRRASVKISIADTASHGLADLWISATRTGTKSTVRTKIKFDGQQYLVDPWNKAFDAWYAQTDRAWLDSLPR